MSQSLVSVIIPVFNEEENIERLLVSIKEQSYENWEAIVVDDGSSDRTVDIAKHHTDKVFLRSHAERSVQRNFGAQEAKGKYFLFLDADMELTPGVIKDCVNNIHSNMGLVIPERTVGKGFMAEVRKFERSMYVGDSTVEVARFFDRLAFMEFGGYDINLTGTEDYDLPKRMSTKYTIGRVKSWILHHETGLTLIKQLKKKYYYAYLSAGYAQKHPDLISKQGILILRMAYFRNWKQFIFNPIMGVTLLVVRFLETSAAAIGFLKAVGLVRFIKTFFKMFKYL